jgi:Flp pilus assembly protein TadG
MSIMLFCRADQRARRRRGVAAVEFAFLAPVLCAILFAVIDFGRAMMSLDLLAHAARGGARVGVLANKSTDDITTAVNASLDGAGIDHTKANVAVTVNGNSANASTAVTGDQVQVTVSVAYGNLTWLPSSWFMGNATLSEAVVMRRE